MQTLTRHSLPRPLRTGVGPSAIALLALCVGKVGATIPAVAPQVLLTITNSESMDGTTGGAIMVGSGALGSSLAQLQNSSSPLQYTVPSGFTPPVQAATNGLANYTALCSSTASTLCDNGASRLNMTKAAIKAVLASYGATINFGIYDYSTSGTSLYNTWVYQMSPAGSNFTFTNTASTATPSTTVPNPCYGYQSFATSTVKNNCTSMAAQINPTTLNSNAYMNVSASSDNPQVNDVYYAAAGPDAVFLDYGQVVPANPYSGPGSYSLNTYNTNINGFNESYPYVVGGNSANVRGTTPTNAGYVPYSKQVMYVQRGFGYGGGQSPLTGASPPPVAMGTDPNTPSGAAKFAAALAPETNAANSLEIKAVAGQSAIAGLLQGARTYLGQIPHATCQSQYVVLMTDGLPTLDYGDGSNPNSAKTWPPLGTITANAYGLTATFDPTTGAFISSNSQAVTDAITAVRALATAGVKVYVIGLGAGVNQATNPTAFSVLQAMAIAGGTSNFFPATDPQSLNNAFQTIVAQIYAASSVAAPLVPKTVQNGSSYEYTATTTTPSAGHVTAYPVDSSGNPTGGPGWTTDNTMTTADRASKLKGGDSLTVLSSLTDTDFGLPPAASRTSCVPTSSTVVAYTINPNPSGQACPGTTYLNGRANNVLLGAFSQQNSDVYLGPPGNPLLLQNTSYLTWARNHATRPGEVLVTSSDGFLYSLNPTTGTLNWGWISKYNLTQLQNYSTFQASAPTNGDFSVVDAFDGSAWNSYVVGSLNSGGTRFSLKLDDSGNPSAVVYDTIVNGGAIPTGTTAGDAVGAAGNAPLRQPPVIAYIGTGAYSIYVVTTSGVSKLYETNVATGATTPAATLNFVVTSALSIDASSNRVWMGASDGHVYDFGVSGNAVNDILNIQTAGQTVNPVNGTAVANVQWVASFKVNGTPYFYAINAGQITVFGGGTTGWIPLWTATSTVNYTYTPPVAANPPAAAVPGNWVLVANSPNLLTANSVVSDMPLVIGGVIVLPTFVPGSGCALGLGYYDFFAVTNGSFPTQALNTIGLTVTGDIQAGQGAAYTPSVTMTGTGYQINEGCQTCTTLPPHISGTVRNGNPSITWRQH